MESAVCNFVIHVHFNYLCFHVHEVSFVFALEREKSKATPSFPLSIFSSKGVTAPSDFLMHTLILPFSLSSFFDKEDDPSRLQYHSWKPTIVLLHSIIIFSGLFSKPPTSNSLAPCLYPLWHAEQSFSPSQPRCHSGIFPWVVTLSAAPLALWVLFPLAAMSSADFAGLGKQLAVHVVLRKMSAPKATPLALKGWWASPTNVL